ncbi:MAG: hypothetical protein V8R81_07170 [Clostridia bacterium]
MKYDALCACSKYRFRVRKSIKCINERGVEDGKIQGIINKGIEEYKKQT